VARSNRGGTRVELDVYGHFLPDDPYEGRFRERCDDVPSARFRGKLPNEAVIPTLQEYDVFAFPTFYEGEGFPGVVVEAFAAGCPVLATDWNYNGEIVRSGVDGLLFEPRDVDELAEKIAWLSDHPAEVEAMQERAAERSQEFSVERVTGDVVRYLDDAGWEVPGERPPRA
jgi:glycosyltransferase involved in cell wall biosynthesis